MRTTDIDISKLFLAERIQLAKDLWDSAAGRDRRPAASRRRRQRRQTQDLEA